MKVVKITTSTTEEYRVVTKEELRELKKKEIKKYYIDEFGIPHLYSPFSVELVGNIVKKKILCTNPAEFERTYWYIYKLNNGKTFIEMQMIRSDGIFNIVVESPIDFNEINSIKDVMKLCPNNICMLNHMLSKD